MTLRTKTSLLLAAITFLALGVTSLFYLQFLQQSLKNSILSGVKAVAEKQRRGHRRFLEDSLQDVEVADLALPTPALEKNDGPALEKRLQQLAKSIQNLKTACSSWTGTAASGWITLRPPKHGAWTRPTGIISSGR